MRVIDKKSLRKQQIQRLQQLPLAVKRQEEAQILAQFLASPLYQQAHEIGVTASSPLEFSTVALIEAAWQDQKVIYLPKTLPDTHGMHFYRYQQGDQLVRSAFGIMEPMAAPTLQNDQPDLLIVPGLAYSRDHWRVGFGGGYYDRFLQNYLGQTVVLALSPMVFTTATWPVSQHDQPFDQLITVESEAN
ncbi:5-formyltetrahydrofolate cyclo-ligase [Lapidilactobacillus achengensis]|uniref:5-formyltetrahydrofolate cyclo-ligase n=1 Tax=Lapidilactobacillus achengensis TaxID=2486000 RepID=UPI000F78B7DF|nr:5-formyltetrahydrofolate cyclo-ligase [Lapidilactobacillus achengensis]